MASPFSRLCVLTLHFVLRFHHSEKEREKDKDKGKDKDKDGDKDKDKELLAGSWPSTGLSRGLLALPLCAFRMHPYHEGLDEYIRRF